MYIACNSFSLSFFLTHARTHIHFSSNLSFSIEFFSRFNSSNSISPFLSFSLSSRSVRSIGSRLVKTGPSKRWWRNKTIDRGWKSINRNGGRRSQRRRRRRTERRWKEPWTNCLRAAITSINLSILRLRISTRFIHFFPRSFLSLFSVFCNHPSPLPLVLPINFWIRPNFFCAFDFSDHFPSSLHLTSLIYFFPFSLSPLYFSLWYIGVISLFFSLFSFKHERQRNENRCYRLNNNIMFLCTFVP